MEKNLPHSIVKAAIVAAFVFCSYSLFSQGPLWSPSGLTGVTTTRQVFVKNSAIVDSSLTANLIISNELRTLGLAQLDALLVNANANFTGKLIANTIFTSGDIKLGNNVSVIHDVSNASFSFNLSGDNVIGLGYNLSDPAARQGLLIAPVGFKGNPNGSIAFGDASPDGQILLALGTGSSGTRINLDGAGKRLVLQNDGGDKFTMGGVNAPTLFETTQGINVAPRLGFTFGGTYLLNLQGGINAQEYYLNGNLIDVPEITDDIAALQTEVDTLQTEVDSLGLVVGSMEPNQWKNTGISSISYSGTAIVDGSFQSNSITTANLTIIGRIESDSMHAKKSLEINNSLRLSRDTTVMYAEMSTKDTAVALVLQKEADAQLVIGSPPPPPLPGEPKGKFSVTGNSYFDGGIKVTGGFSALGNIGAAGNMSANCVITSCLNVNGQANFDSLNVTNRIKIGTSSLYVGGLGPGNPIGGLDNNIYSTNGALSLQNGSTFNTLINPTGGNVAIGTSAPLAQLDVRIPIDNNKIGAMVKNSSNDGIFIVPKLGPGGFNYHSVEGDAGILWDGYNPSSGLVIGPWYTQGWRGMRISHEGNVSIGTTQPTERLHIQNGSIYLEGENQGIIVDEGANKRVGLIKYPGHTTGIWRTTGQNFEIGRVNVSSLPGSPASFITDLLIGGDGNVSINDENDIKLRNTHHGLGWYGDPDGNSQTTPNKYFNGKNIDGPVLYGYGGGALGVKTTEYDESLYQDVEVERIALRWNERGNIGIGTTNPDEQLQIYGVAPAIHLVDYTAQGATTDTTSFIIRADNGAARLISNQSVGIFINGDNNDNNRSFTINDNGNAYDGTVKTLFEISETGDAWLYGKLQACSVRVNILSGCDFVFDENYSLLSLKKRREKVLPAKHLLNVIPAKEMEKSGVDLGQTTMGILQNVEEHELYLYSLDERMELLEKENKELRAIINELKKEIIELKK